LYQAITLITLKQNIMTDLKTILANGFTQYYSDRVEYFNNMSLCVIERVFLNKDGLKLCVKWNNDKVVDVVLYKFMNNIGQPQNIDFLLTK